MFLSASVPITFVLARHRGLSSHHGRCRGIGRLVALHLALHYKRVVTDILYVTGINYSETRINNE
jgi:hypothetical protein